ncbi:MAG TPA: hypothetical protein VFI31_28160 [Pirellulales bacterium]|nr:hypothetical protein [Pirellulales bacterium]
MKKFQLGGTAVATCIVIAFGDIGPEPPGAIIPLDMPIPVPVPITGGDGTITVWVAGALT